MLLEQVASDVRGVADGVTISAERIDQLERTMHERFDRLEGRMDRLEAEVRAIRSIIGTTKRPNFTPSQSRSPGGSAGTGNDHPQATLISAPPIGSERLSSGTCRIAGGDPPRLPPTPPARRVLQRPETVWRRSPR